MTTTYTTPNQLLADSQCRRHARQCAADGRGYSAWLCAQAGSRDVAVAAVARLVQRDQRGHDRRIAVRAYTHGDRSPNEIAELAARRSRERAAKREADAKTRVTRRLRKGTIGEAAFGRLLPSLLETVSQNANAAIRRVCTLVGPLGEQAERDLGEMTTGEVFAGKKGRNHKLERTTLSRVQHTRDWSAALITLRDYRSFGSNSWGDSNSHYGSRGGSSFRVYLIVRDSTNGESHILRVAPKFGNDETQFFAKFRDDAARIHAAVASTFGLRAEQYQPQITA